MSAKQQKDGLKVIHSSISLTNDEKNSLTNIVQPQVPTPVNLPISQSHFMVTDHCHKNHRHKNTDISAPAQLGRL